MTRGSWPPWRVALAVGGVVALAACGVIAPSEDRVPGIIESYGQGLVFEAPDTVAVGVPFAAGVRTYGGGCRKKGDVSVSIEGRHATILPIDRYENASGCNDDLAFFWHTVEVVFETPGTAELRVVGVVEPGDSLVVRRRNVEVR